jgi:hypothetical protein
MGRDIARFDVTAVEDTLCYSIPGTVVQDLASRHPEFSEYLVRVSITRYLDRSLKELKDQTNLMGNTERLLYSLAVKDVVSAPVVVCTGVNRSGRLLSSFRPRTRPRWPWLGRRPCRRHGHGSRFYLPGRGRACRSIFL